MTSKLKPQQERDKLADSRDALSEALSNLESLAKHSADRRDSLESHIAILRNEHEWVKQELTAFDKGADKGAALPTNLWGSHSISRQ